jgi:hypothetical protein
MRSSQKRSDLLAAIQRKAPSAPESVAPEPLPRVTDEKPEPRRKESRSVTEKPKPLRGRAQNVWLHAEDDKLVRELSAWLAGQGVRISDSRVIRAALHTAQTGTAFLHAYRKAAELDGRLKKHRAKKTVETA